ncbi:hypothetical protein [Brachybacterium sp. GPGPB12]|uniref:hypothetical protein n=1 Tax=Brachybacterium sp. GPGPB12 TaxID=3023517 RepID=UPI0031342BE3
MEENLSVTARERYRILFGRRNAHRRTPSEYERPEEILHIATWETARSIALDDPRGFDARPLTWTGVRGSWYCDPTQWFYPPDEWVETWGELVPEPFNRHDSSAVGIDLDGIRLGYAPAGYARYTHTCVCALNNRGFRVLIPPRYRSDYSRDLNLLLAHAYAAPPTFGEWDKILPTDEECAQLLQPLWNALDDSAREQINRDRYGLTDKTLPHLIALRHLAPDVGLPSIPRLSAVTYQVDRFVKAQQSAWRQQRDDQIIAAFREGWRKSDISKRHEVSYSVISRILKETGIDTRAPRVTPDQRRVRTEIVAMLKRGSSRREINDALGVTYHAIAAVAKEAGVDVPSQSGVNDYSHEQDA